MDIALTLLMIIVAWRVLCLRYQRTHISLLAAHLANLRLERHMETLTQGYSRAIREETESRQLQVLDTFSQTERAVAAQVQALADAMQKESAQASGMGAFRFCIPYDERLFPSLARDFRALLRIHAAGLRHVVDNEGSWSPKDRA